MTAHSEQLHDLAAALAEAQAQIDPANADGVGRIEHQGEVQSYHYATLASVWKAVRRVLTQHGLSIVQTCEPGDPGELRLTTTLLHRSGQWISGTAVLPLPAQSPQGYGSALTYARRYGLAAMVGLCVDHDDDGFAGSQTAPARPTGRQPGAGRRSAEAPRRGTQPRARAAAQAWRQVPYNQATAGELRAFATAYARAKGVDAIGKEDVRRDFGIDGRLVDYFGATPLGQIVDRVRASGPGTEPADSPKPGADQASTPESRAA